MDTIELRRPLFLLAVAALTLVVLIEIGSAVLHATATAARPGYGISFLVGIDGLLLYSLILMTISMLVSRELTGRLQGLVGVILSFLAGIALLAAILSVFALLQVMIGLLLAPIFGTIAYFALFGTFNVSGAAATLMLLLVLKMFFAICLIFAHPRFLQNKSLVTLVLLSLLCTFLVSFLQSFPPGFLVSITDAVAALVIGIIALIWVVVLFFGSVVATVKAVL